MFVARYPFVAKFAQSISFASGDHFLGLRKENDHWFYVFHEDGRLGAIPTNYVEESNLKSPEEVAKIIDAAVNAISSADIFEKEIILNYLKHLRSGLLAGHNKDKLPRLPVRQKARQRVQPIDARANAPSKKVSIAAEEQKSPSPVPPSKRPPGVAYLMVDKLRNSTLTSFDRCVTGFVKMMKVLADADPQLAGLSNELIRELLDSNPTVRRSVYVRTEDWKVLQKCVAHLEQRAKDLQESSWPLSEDETTAISELDSFVELLCNMDPDMVCRCISDDDFPMALSYLYQQERRSLVRRFYLLVVVAICHIQPRTWNVLLDSCIPVEIMREIRSSELAELDFVLDLRVLTVLFAKTNCLPMSISNELNESFFDTVFTQISRLVSGVGGSKSGGTGVKDQGDGDSHSRPSSFLLDSFMQFVCSANRHFCVSAQNLTPILSTMLANHIATKDLIERLLFIFNRDVDPLSLDGVSFVRRLRGTLSGSFDLSSDLYNGSLLYQNPSGESDSGLCARSFRFSFGHNGFAGDVFGNDLEVSGNGEHASGPTRIPLQHRPSLTDVALQNAPDTPVNAARKLLADIFSTRETAGLVYRNDVNVVIDVIIRQICDLPATSPNLPEFLFCMDKVIRNTDCMSRSGGPYRLDDLKEALRGVEYSANASSASGARDYCISRSMRLTNDLLTLLSAMSS
ncbi:hypothetical protein Aperf_G00000026313 [Anoplocephala perfoliata]